MPLSDHWVYTHFGQSVFLSFLAIHQNTLVGFIVSACGIWIGVSGIGFSDTSKPQNVTVEMPLFEAPTLHEILPSEFSSLLKNAWLPVIGLSNFIIVKSFQSVRGRVVDRL